MRKTKLISILTFLTTLTTSAVVVSCSTDDKTTILHKQTDINKLDLNTNLYDIKDTNPSTIIKTFLELNDQKLVNLHEDQLEVKMINNSNAVINVKDSNEFIGNTNIKFELKDNQTNSSSINWSTLTPTISVSEKTSLTPINNTSEKTTLIPTTSVSEKTSLTPINNINERTSSTPTTSNNERTIKPAVKPINTTETKKAKSNESELIPAFNLKPAKVNRPSEPSKPRRRREVREEKLVNVAEITTATNSVPWTPLTPATHTTPLTPLSPATTVSPSIAPISPVVQPAKEHIEEPIVDLAIKSDETFETIDIKSDSNIDDLYINQTLKAFNKINLSEQKAKELMLRNDVAANFYSHPRFELNKKEIVLDKHQNKRVELKLFDKNTQKEINNSEVKWYQRTRYPEDKVFGVNENDNGTTFNLLDNGVLEWKDTKESDGRTPDEKSAVIWASYKGYLYSTTVRVFSEHVSDMVNNEELAKQAAKDLVKEKGWNNLPPLERLIKAYEWMTKEVKYDHDLTSGPILKNQNAYSALVLRYTVCTGYAKGFKLILDELGIPCRFMEGSSDRESTISKHAWNLVQIDNEWYHVDTTSDRTKDQTNFNFFLNTNDDFVKKDTFDREFKNKGTRLRNFKFKNFVVTEEDALALIDNNWNPDTKQIGKLDVITNEHNFNTVYKAFEKRKLDSYIKTSRFTLVIGPNKQATYTFNPQTQENVTNVQVTKVEQYQDKHAIKIELSQKVDDLKKGNFNIKNALIKEVKQENNSYILTLDHFSSYNEVKVELESIKRKDYKFTLTSDNTVKFNIQRQTQPNAIIQVLSDDSIKITNNLSHLEYNFNNASWADVPANSIIPKSTIGKLYLRYKGSDSKLSSDIQTISISRSQIPTNHNIKSINKTLVGVNYTMQYRLKDSNTNWTNITANKVKNLGSGTYQVRIKPSKHSLASEIVEISVN
ncbi:MAG6410 family transglutaminase-related lipoprotein [Mycoplasma feriruminatoris]|uniref:MAG6410 family transglutaminase-related lipoprotein n=1 Tax=Mycoplasma feriruminatoris TaxID=1179777 RepID=UPI0002A4EA48|nr:transglutaminase domain-containing protein [Mycoplasma feriruminatoris]UKS54234.1 transglutaminase-like superfamily protein [Mycoplasma feriruminatoris]VZK65406.1 hypothetical protein MF5292_00581 [Mycoplasma feriruminatoris]VZR75551.1 hypothetical protein MF5294_00581 [Mycoplasma feriruminatoris]VZR97985.1 hypothetical protein MF5293_00578 [Mycoplasma feriruminatoris]